MLCVCVFFFVIIIIIILGCYLFIDFFDAYVFFWVHYICFYFFCFKSSCHQVLWRCWFWQRHEHELLGDKVYRNCILGIHLNTNGGIVGWRNCFYWLCGGGRCLVSCIKLNCIAWEIWLDSCIQWDIKIHSWLVKVVIICKTTPWIIAVVVVNIFSYCQVDGIFLYQVENIYHCGANWNKIVNAVCILTLVVIDVRCNFCKGEVYEKKIFARVYVSFW